MIEPAETADLGDQRRGVHDRDATQCLQGFDHRRQRPCRQQVDDRLIEACAQLVGPLDPLDMLLQHQMLSRVHEAQVGQPAAMGLAPTRARIAQPMA
jgi:hypothetical protein